MLDLAAGTPSNPGLYSGLRSLSVIRIMNYELVGDPRSIVDCCY
jgi:hypothetical protein